MNSINEAIGIITGGKSGGYYLAGAVFSFLAIILSIYVRAQDRFKCAPETPPKWSWKFFWWDNTKRIFAGLIVMFLFFRLFDLSNVFAMVGFGFAISFGLDRLIKLLMDKTQLLNFLSTDRSKQPEIKQPDK